MTNLNQKTLEINDFANISLQTKERGLSSLPDNILLAWMEDRLQVKEDIKNHPSVTQRWVDNMNDELSAIEWELESCKPDCEFQILLDKDIALIWFEEIGKYLAFNVSVGFEPIYGEVI
jgi:hypothetical protein